MEISVKEIATIIEAKNDWSKWADVVFSSVEMDSRLVKSGSLFIPLKGTRDGHEFIQTAITQGASATLWGQDVEKVPVDCPYLLVEEPLHAMQQIAQYYLKKIEPKVIGITGSNGKTTTKDMVAAVVSERYVTYKTQGNYNNDIGLPYTILHMPKETEILVLEMGMDHRGEIQFLSTLAQPDIAAITIVGESHIEFFGSRQGIAEAKMEIVEGLDEGGLLIVPADEPLLAPLLKKVTQQVVTFGQGTGDMQGKIISETKHATSFQVAAFGETTFTIPVLGNYNVNNALIALTIGHHLGVSESAMKQGLATMHLTKNRTEWKTAWNGAEILSDVYNANPTAMALVLDTFSALPCEGKKIAVLADMGELGEKAPELHERIAKHLSEDTIQEVYLYGTLMNHLYKTLQSKYAPENLHYFPMEEKELLTKTLKKTLGKQDMILLKGSNSMNLVEIVEKLSEK